MACCLAAHCDSYMLAWHRPGTCVLPRDRPELAPRRLEVEHAEGCVHAHEIRPPCPTDAESGATSARVHEAEVTRTLNVVLYRGDREAPGPQSLDGFAGAGREAFDFDYDLSRLPPLLFGEAIEDVQLRAFDVDLEQVDSRYLMPAQEVG